MNEGCVYWVTGLSGAGKTTIGKKIYDYLKKSIDKVILLDGDKLREVFQNSDYSYEGRRELGMQYARLCKMISSQGIDVVICTIGMFNEIRDWNRKNILNYKEIFLDVPLEELELRNQKKLYSRIKNGEICNMYGIDMEVQFPKYPDIVIQNYGDITPQIAFEKIREKVLQKI